MSVGFRASLEPSTLAASMAHEEDIAVGPRAAMAEGGSGFRPDIEGLRAVSVLLVLVYHAGVARVKGGFVGVDVFFVISGFLITGLLVRELESTGRISLLGFYARRAKRLLPATALVLVATAAATWAFLPLTDRATFATDIFSAAFYVVNWRLADRSVDYLAEDVGPSPVQHFWSLAVEEQFYIVWPLLLALAAWIFRRRGGVGRTRLAFALAFVAVPSFVWSLRLTSRDSATAFFVTTTRLWELAVGAAVAIGERRWSALSRPVAVGLGWAGLVAIACSAFLFREGARWPGFGALLPTLGAAAVIVAGHVPTTAGAARFLSLSPMVWIGGLSYSLYLWHWPLLVAARGRFGDLGPLRGLLVVGASFAPAWVSRRFVENPIRFSKAIGASPRLALSLGLNFSLAGGVSGLALLLIPMEEPKSATPEGGGRAGPLRPNPLKAAKDVPRAALDGCQIGQTDETPVECAGGDPNATIDVVLAGDSKMMQWYSAFDDVGRANHFRVRTLTKSSCALLSTLPEQPSRNESCVKWNELVFEKLLANPPHILVTSQGAGYIDGEIVAATLAEDWRTFEEHGIRVVALIDNPAPKGAPDECVAKNLKEPGVCAFPREPAIERSGAPRQRAAAALVPNVTVIDFTPEICPADPCQVVIDNVLVYRQRAHLTDTYVRTLERPLSVAMRPVLGKVRP